MSYYGFLWPHPLGTQALLVGVASGEVGVYQLKNVPHTADKVSPKTVPLYYLFIYYDCTMTVQEVLLSIVDTAVAELQS